MESGKKVIIIGLLGESKTGKDTVVARDIIDFYVNRKPVILKAADILKSEAEKRYPHSFCKETWEKSGDSYREVHVEELGFSRRALLQNLGDTLLEEDPFYIKTYFDRVLKEKSKEFNLILVTDLRNESECRAVKSNGAFIIKVKRYLSLRYPEIANDYFLKEEERSFLEFIEEYYPHIHTKLSHKTETSIEKVNSKYIDLVLWNNRDKDKYITSLKIFLYKIEPV